MGKASKDNHTDDGEGAVGEDDLHHNAIHAGADAAGDAAGRVSDTAGAVSDAAARAKQAREDLKGTRYELLHPTVSMSTGYNWQLSRGEQFQGPEDLFLKNYGYSLSMTVSLPVFNRFSTQNSIKSQQLGYRQSMQDLEQAKRQVALDIRQAFLNIELYSRSIEAQRIAVSAAEESYKLAQERYDLSTGTQLERLQAQSALFAARSDLVQAQFNYHIQLAQLDQAMGTPATR